ncbi:hypothetical protein ES707_12936 [subsurface metagenome]
MDRKAATVQTGNTRKIGFVVFAFMIVCFGVPAAFALDTMGLPAAGLRQGQYSVGVDYSHSKMDLKLSEGIQHDYVYGSYDISWDLEALILKDFKVDRGYLNLGYGISDMIEAFLRVGGATGKFGDSLWEGEEEFDGDWDFSIGAGAKATFYEDDKLKIGGLIQVSWNQFDGTLKPDDWPTFYYPGADNIKIEITEVQIAVGPTYELEEDVLIYGGPFYHYVNGELDDTYSYFEIDEDNIEYFLTSEYHWAMEEDASYGGYIGTRLELAEDCSFNMEYQLTGAAYCIGASIRWRF